MPVTYPVVENIARELLTRLRAMINSATYQTKVRSVVRPTRNGNYTPEHLQIVMADGGSEFVPELDCIGDPPAVARRHTFNVHCHLLTDEKSIIAIDAEVHTFVADVVKAVSTPANTWHTFDDNAIDARILEPEFIGGDGSLEGALVPITVVYRTDQNDPYEVR